MFVAEEFYETEDLAMHNVDVMTDASAFTAFTRYTVAPSTSAPSRATTKRTSRSKRKMERKVSSGRKGTVDEEEYLLKSLTKLTIKLSEAQGTCSNSPPPFSPKIRIRQQTRLRRSCLTCSDCSHPYTGRPLVSCRRRWPLSRVRSWRRSMRCGPRRPPRTQRRL